MATPTLFNCSNVLSMIQECIVQVSPAALGARRIEKGDDELSE